MPTVRARDGVCTVHTEFTASSIARQLRDLALGSVLTAIASNGIAGKDITPNMERWLRCHA